MATTTVTGVAVDGNGTPYAAKVTVTVVSSEAALFDGDGDVIASRSHSELAAGDGTYAVACERQSGITNDGSTVVPTTTTIKVGTEFVAAGLIIPDSGPVTLASLIPSSTDHTVAVTTRAIDDSEAGIAGLSVPAMLSKACYNLNGDLILPSHPFKPTADTLGNILWRLDRTDQLTPVDDPLVEPYYRFTFGADAVVNKRVHGAGTLASMPGALSTTEGTFAGTSDDLPHTAEVVAYPDDVNPVPTLMHHDFNNLAGRTDVGQRLVTGDTTVLSTDKLLIIDASGGPITVQFPLVADRRQPVACSIKDASNDVTFTPHAGQTMNLISTIVASTTNEMVIFWPETGTTNWVTDVGISSAGTSADATLALDFDFGFGTGDAEAGLSVLAAAPWTDVGPEQSFTVSDDAVLLLVNLLGNAICDQNCDARIVIDAGGTPVTHIYHSGSQLAFVNILQGCVLVDAASALTPGVHTLKVQVQPAADGTVYCRTDRAGDGAGAAEAFLMQVACITKSGGGGGSGGSGPGTDTSAVHRDPLAAESGSLHIDGTGTFDTQVTTNIVSAAQLLSSGNIQAATYVLTKRLHNSGSFVTTAVNDASPGAGTGATFTRASGSCDLSGKVTLVTGTGSTAGHMGDVLFTSTLDDPASANGQFYPKNLAAAALMPYTLDKSDGTGIELWVLVAPDDATTYAFAYFATGA